jgi:2'-deoxynucleoside 5'-phosphate N-hydrolase
MQIYFTASIVGKKQYLTNYKSIVSILSNNGKKVISQHIIDSQENNIRMESKVERLKFHEKLDKWINTSDCIVAETSFPSISVGYEISLALSHGKPVLILYSEGNPPTLLAQHKDENLICEKYTPSTLSGIIEDFLNYVEGKEDSRFTFYVTSEIAAYLEKVSRDEKLPKAVYLRKLIEEDMKKTR